ncbi:MAG: hypothetical protein HY828_02490 [Actinobacteria bacterium]|nr:hypothetical protein [Actinomycetota bacterium]
MALNIHHTTQLPSPRAAGGERTVRPRHLVLAMAAGLFAIVVGVWRWAPDTDTPAPSQRPVSSIVSSPAKP